MNKFSKTEILRRFHGAELIQIRIEMDRFVKSHLCYFKVPAPLSSCIATSREQVLGVSNPEKGLDYGDGDALLPPEWRLSSVLFVCAHTVSSVPRTVASP